MARSLHIHNPLSISSHLLSHAVRLHFGQYSIRLWLFGERELRIQMVKSTLTVGCTVRHASMSGYARYHTFDKIIQPPAQAPLIVRHPLSILIIMANTVAGMTENVFEELCERPLVNYDSASKWIAVNAKDADGLTNRSNPSLLR